MGDCNTLSTIILHLVPRYRTAARSFAYHDHAAAAVHYAEHATKISCTVPVTGRQSAPDGAMFICAETVVMDTKNWLAVLLGHDYFLLK